LEREVFFSAASALPDLDVTPRLDWIRSGARFERAWVNGGRIKGPGMTQHDVRE
jgi:hypothetical protein